MANRIRILDDNIVNQIAAGEVVERPASVVKELLENSIDAGAAQITVAVTGGGRSLIEVSDDGCGMSRQDALLAVERFGTSKISDVSDLRAIATHGFRGEALPSIASVSRFTLCTREQEQDLPGCEISIEGGRLGGAVEKQMPGGTRVSVRDLFFNVPARRKFLRSETTETGLIRALLTDFAAAYPRIRFSLVIDGQEALCFSPVASFSDRLQQLRIGKERLLLIDEERESAGALLRICAALSQPVDAVADAGRLRLIINKRSVRDRLLLRAVRDGYGTYLKPGRYPQGVLCVDLPVDLVDVNVHPQKSEVRFREPGAVFGIVRGCITQALRISSPQEVYHQAQPEFGSAGRQYQLRPFVQFEAGSRAGQSAPVQAGLFTAPAPGQPDAGASQLLSSMRFVGQIFQLYLLLEGGERVAIVDLHAAHERVMFFKLKSQFITGSLAAQQLLLPETVPVPPEAAAGFAAAVPALERLGIESELFGEGCVMVRTVPALLAGASGTRVLRDLFSLADGSDWAQFLEQRIDQVLARLACHTAVRSGVQLERQEVYELLQSLEQAESAAFCPHGRPVAVFLDSSELAAMFGRTGFGSGPG